METISVQNPRTGQVAHFSVTGSDDPRAQVLAARIATGRLEKATISTKRARKRTVVEIDQGVRDEKGDLLKSIHGGGIDPDAAGDTLGNPSGSGLSATEAAADAQVAAAAVQQQAANAAEAGAKLSATATAAAAAAGPVDASLIKSGSDSTTSAEDGPFDPGKHTIPDVEAYLASADEAERTRVLDAERAGKNRAKLVGSAS